MSKLSAAWAWLERNWKTIGLIVVFPIGLLVLLSKLQRPKVLVTSPELSEHRRLEKSLQQQSEKAKLEVVKRKAERDEEIEVEFEEEIAEVREEAHDDVARLRTDPEAINEFLKQVGRDVRRKH